MSVDLVLRCDVCPASESDLPQRSLAAVRAQACAGAGWDRREVAAEDGSTVVLDLCPDCRHRPDAELVHVYENEPF